MENLEEEKKFIKTKDVITIRLWIVIILWVIVILTSVRAGYTGDDGTRFGLAILFLPLAFLSVIGGLISMQRIARLEKKLEALNQKISFKSLWNLSTLVVLSPLLAFVVSLLLGLVFGQKPFSGA